MTLHALLFKTYTGIVSTNFNTRNYVLLKSQPRIYSQLFLKFPKFQPGSYILKKTNCCKKGDVISYLCQSPFSHHATVYEETFISSLLSCLKKCIAMCNSIDSNFAIGVCSRNLRFAN